MTSYGYDINTIARTLLSKGLTKAALAKLASVDPGTVTNVLKGISGTPTTIGKIANALEIDLADITIPLVEPVETAADVDLQTRTAATNIQQPARNIQ